MTLTRVSAKKRKRVFLLRADGKYFKNGGRRYIRKNRIKLPPYRHKILKKSP